MTTIKLYMAHPITERYYVRYKFQPKIEESDVEIINPFICRPNGDRIFFGEDAKDKFEVMTEEFGTITPQEVVRMEQGMIQSCDGVVAYIPEATIGTTMEIMFNSVVLNRGKERTFVYTRDSYLKVHPWLQTFTTICTSMKELKEKIREAYKLGTDRKN